METISPNMYMCVQRGGRMTETSLVHVLVDYTYLHESNGRRCPFDIQQNNIRPSRFALTVTIFRHNSLV